MSHCLTRMLMLGAVALMPWLTACGLEEPSPATPDGTATVTDELISFPPPPPPVIDLCPAASPDAVLSMGSVSAVSSHSPDGSYGAKPYCNSWVVDIHVPANTQGLPGYSVVLLDGGPLDDIMLRNVSQAWCESYRARRTLYKRAAGTTSFVKVDTRSGAGVWMQDDPLWGTLCWVPGFETYGVRPPASGTDVYRVVTQARIDEGGGRYQYRNVRAAASLPPRVH